MRTMNSKIKLAIVFSLALSFVLLPTCKRKEVTEPGPLGPSGFSVVLKLSASPNVISAGTSRDSTTITASLTKYDGIALSDKTIHFEIRDQSGNKLYLGYFEGNKSVISKTTDGNGEARVTYYGPLGDELTDTTYIYIFASASWDGKEFVSELTPIKVVRDVEEITIELVANPKVIVADTYREVSTITATVTQTGGIPLANETLLFEITDESGSQLNLGYFEGQHSVIEKTTDSNGMAQVQYFGPIAQEITEDTTIYIKVWCSQQTKECTSATTPICIVRESKDLSIELFAIPDVLWVSTQRPTSTIKAYLKKGSFPLPDIKVYFTITEGDGTFSNNQTNKFAYTDESGIATVEYMGPTEDEISADQTVTIQAHADAGGPDTATAEVQIQLLLETTGPTLELTADPNVLLCGDDRSTSLISAYYSQGGDPLAGKKIIFTLPDGLGLFANDQTTITAWTNENGVAAVTYRSPTNAELSADQTITLQAQAVTSSPDFVTATVQIQLIRIE